MDNLYTSRPTDLAQIQAAIGITDFVVLGAQPGRDARALILAAIARCKDAGGGRVVLPFIGGYQISDEIRVDFSNCTIVLQDSVRLTKTTAARAFYFLGLVGSPISNSGIVGDGARRQIDANGRNITGYTYNASGPLYPAVHLKYVRNGFARNVWGYNGLVNSIVSEFCQGTQIVDCDGTDAVYDNGVSSNFTPSWVAFSDTDPSTWTNAVFMRCRAWNNKGIGITNYAGVGHLIAACLCYSNGNDIANFPTNGGGISIEANTFGSEQIAARDSHTKIVDTSVVNNINIGIFIGCQGVDLDTVDISGTIAPINRPNPATQYGSNLQILGHGNARAVNVRLSGAGTNGIILLATTTAFFPQLNFDGEILRSGSHGIYGKGVGQLTTSPATLVQESGWDKVAGALKNANFNGIRIENDSASYNIGSGQATISGRFVFSASRPIDVLGIGEFVGPSITGRFNRQGIATTGSQYRFDTVARVDILSIRNRDAAGFNSTSYVVEILASCTKGFVGLATGDATISPVSNLASGGQPPRFVATSG